MEVAELEVGVLEVAEPEVGVPVEVEDLDGLEAQVAGETREDTETEVGVEAVLVAGVPERVVETASLEAGVKEALEDTVEEVKVQGAGVVDSEDSPLTLQRDSLPEDK